MMRPSSSCICRLGTRTDMSICVSAMPVQLSGHEHLTGPMTTVLGDQFIHGKECLDCR